MSPPFLAHTLLLFSFLLLSLYARAATSYISDFVDPDYVSARRFDIRTYRAQITILKWARELARSGPWTITNRTVLPPSGDKHDYMSWISNAWPNCTSVGNTTVLIDEEVWRLCTYENKDKINPDTIPVNTASSDAFDTMSNAVLYNSIASVIAGGNSNIFSRNAASYLQTWFLDPELKMNPNLNYAQMKRGPKGQHGGIMELRGFVKIVSGIIILRSTKTIDYTQAIDQGMVSWCSQYIQWLETSTVAIQESIMVNYHATFYYSQLASLKILVNDWQGAMGTINIFVGNQFMNQIDGTGEQPLEQNSFAPQHYRIMNLAALITLARIAKYVDPTSTSSELWNKTTSAGGTIQLALDFAMSQARPMAMPPGLEGDMDSDVRDLAPLVAAVGSTFGDPDKRYQNFLSEADPNYAEKPYFLWNQPFAGGPSPTSDSEKARMTSRVGNGASAESVELVTPIAVVMLTMLMI
ncbi:hypothetical protein Moror_9837 [Moniliophthora roreri MCA 2997]|uniref:Alginate lyase domain-containing protein n=1 Tax=Moniliophthora roreri (strain MCA 2997) TaxID=1381753 RepID=V2WY72_MONRO|nr:hypothetical protein Moror_9837 [Moniliophthora roreri MCA 2997]